MANMQGKTPKPKHWTSETARVELKRLSKGGTRGPLVWTYRERRADIPDMPLLRKPQCR